MVKPRTKQERMVLVFYKEAQEKVVELVAFMREQLVGRKVVLTKMEPKYHTTDTYRRKITVDGFPVFIAASKTQYMLRGETPRWWIRIKSKVNTWTERKYAYYQIGKTTNLAAAVKTMCRRILRWQQESRDLHEAKVARKLREVQTKKVFKKYARFGKGRKNVACLVEGVDNVDLHDWNDRYEIEFKTDSLDTMAELLAKLRKAKIIK